MILPFSKKAFLFDEGSYVGILEIRNSSETNYLWKALMNHISETVYVNKQTL